MRKAVNAGLITREPKKKILEMMVAIGGNLSDFASSDDEEDGNNENNEDTKLGKLRQDDKPGLVMGTISKTVLQRIGRCWQIWMNLDKLVQPV
jgi:hypothetical protein